MTTEEFKIRVLPAKDKLFRLAGRMLNDRAEAQDIVQEVFCRIWSKGDDVQRYRNIEAFAMVMTKNLCLDRIRSKSFRQNDLNETNEPVDNHSPEIITERKDSVSHVHQLIAKLPGQQRAIIQMRDIEEMEYKEIAKVMKMNTNAVRVSLSRARKEIRDQMIKKQNYEYQ